MKNILLNLFKNYPSKVKSFGFLYGIFLILANYILVYLLDSIIYRILCLLRINQGILFNQLIIFFNLINSLLSIYLLFYISTDDNLKIINNFKIKKTDFIYIFIIILTFRFFYDNSFFLLISNFFNPKNKLTTINYFSITIFISTVFIAPLIEELLYRGLILKGFLEKYNVHKSILLCSLIFSSMHSNLTQAINAFFVSIFINYIFLYSKSLILVIFAHFINNALVMLIETTLLFKYPRLTLLIIPLSLLFFLIAIKKLNIKNREYPLV